MPGEQFATIDKALDARTIGHNPERLSLLQGGIVYANQVPSLAPLSCFSVLFFTSILKMVARTDF